MYLDNSHEAIKYVKFTNKEKKMKIKTVLIALFISVFGLSSLSAFAADVVKVRDYSDLKSLDPAFSSGLFDESLQNLIYSKLIQYKPGREWGYVLDAAESIEQSTPTTIDFKLKEGIMFSNGFGEMTAEDVKYSFERMIDPDLGAFNLPDWGPLKEVVVNSKYEGTIVFNKPYPPAWTIALPYIVGNIISKKPGNLLVVK